MDEYLNQIKRDLIRWKKAMQKKPSLVSKASKGVQTKINGLYPEKFHSFMTSTIKNMCKTVLFGSQYTTPPPKTNLSIQERDTLALEALQRYRTLAMVEGAGTGAGGFFVGLADFPLLLSIKIKLLYELAAIYGFNTKDYTERVYLLSIFELAFSSQSHVNDVFQKLLYWDVYKNNLPTHVNDFDWRTFQQEYRDYLDIAKLLQLMPVIGAPVGAYVNNKLLTKLGHTAIQAFHMRWLS